MPEGLRLLLRTRAGRVGAGLLALLALLTVVGVAVLWPGPPRLDAGGSGLPLGSDPARVTGVVERDCGLSSPCRDVRFRVSGGPAEGRTASTLLGRRPTDPDVAVGDRVRALETGGAYVLVDVDRRRPLLLLAALAVVAILAVGRLRGLRSLAGLATVAVVLVGFTVPALLGGGPPVPIALTTCGVVLVATVLLTHGIGAVSVAAVLGAAATLVLTAVLAAVAVAATGLTGVATEASSLLGAGGVLSLPGLLLAGILIGALGVLDDATISQASVVAALRRADPAMPLRRLVGEAMRVGRDHLGALVNTLVLAYAGASLPVLLVFALEDAPLGGVLGTEAVAGEVVATLVGTIGIVLAIPLTTVVAAVLVRGVGDDALAADAHHGHAH